jgi:hypothetical protein
MVRLTAEIKRAFLSALYLGGMPTATPLSASLQSFLLTGFSACKTGRLVVSHSGAGKTTVFQVPRVDQYFQEQEILGLAQELIEIYTDAITAIIDLTVAPAVPDTSDSNVYAVMLRDDRLQDICKTYPDFTTLLMPNR